MGKYCEKTLRNKTFNLIGLAGYEVDVNTGKVYTYKLGFERHEMKPVRRKDDTHHQYSFSVDGKQILIGIGRLVASAIYSCSYKKLPQDVKFSFEQGKLVMRNYHELGILQRDRYRERCSANRLLYAQRVTKEIELIMKAYKGDSDPLKDYLFSHYDNYLDNVQRCRRSRGYGGVQSIRECVTEAVMKTFEEICGGYKNILLLDSYIKEKSIKLLRDRKREKTVPFNDEILYKQVI